MDIRKRAGGNSWIEKKRENQSVLALLGSGGIPSLCLGCQKLGDACGSERERAKGATDRNTKRCFKWGERVESKEELTQAWASDFQRVGKGNEVRQITSVGAARELF